MKGLVSAEQTCIKSPLFLGMTLTYFIFTLEQWCHLDRADIYSVKKKWFYIQDDSIYYQSIRLFDLSLLPLTLAKTEMTPL